LKISSSDETTPFDKIRLPVNDVPESSCFTIRFTLSKDVSTYQTMKVTLVSTALAAILSVSSGFENHAEEQNERRLRWGWDKGAVFLKYKGINDRCCGEDLTECEFKFRSWKLFGLKDK